jgi:hypothetical protein
MRLLHASVRDLCFPSCTDCMLPWFKALIVCFRDLCSCYARTDAFLPPLHSGLHALCRRWLLLVASSHRIPIHFSGVLHVWLIVICREVGWSYKGWKYCFQDSTNWEPLVVNHGDGEVKFARWSNLDPKKLTLFNHVLLVWTVHVSR